MSEGVDGQAPEAPLPPRTERVDRLRATGVDKAFPGTKALREASLVVAPGEVHALAGGNGSGKSTFIKILAGILRADEGSLAIDGVDVSLHTMDPVTARARGMHFVHQEHSTFRSLTVSENLSLGRGFESRRRVLIDGRAVFRRATDVLDRFGIEAGPDDVLGDLSAAQQTMVAIARALQDQEEAGGGVLVLDEPTSSLHPREVERLLLALRRYAADGQSIILVTHRLDELLAVADRITVFRDGRNVAMGITPDVGHDGLVELIVGRKADTYFPSAPQISNAPTVLEFRDVAGGSVHGVDLSVREGELVGLAGLLGSGASTVLRLAAGIQKPARGHIETFGQQGMVRSSATARAQGVAYLPPDRLEQAVFPEESVRENLLVTSLKEFTKLGWLSLRDQRRAVRTDLARYRVRAASMEMPISGLSGGNQQKVVLARWLRCRPGLLLLDEPTQGVDVGARADIWRLVDEALAGGAAAVVASSDLEELAAVCHRVAVLVNGRIVGELSGDALTTERLMALMQSEGADAQ